MSASVPSSADRDPLDVLAEEFVNLLRAGQRPSIDDFAQRLPNRAADVHELFPALVEMEQLKPHTGEFTGDYVPAPALPGDPLQVGEYRILRRVGQGGMGVVYEAIQESLGRHVALKLLPPEALLDPKRLERFRREAKSAACLHHTNIVPVYGTGEADGRYYYAMQFIAGHPLDAVIEEVRRLNGGQDANKPSGPAVSQVAEALLTGSFAAETITVAGGSSPAANADSAPSATTNASVTSASLSTAGGTYWTTVARIGVQVASALGYAHEQGVLHRDIKPSNLMLDLRGTVWVTDFGLAKSADADDITHTGDVIGTLRYMAPERFDATDDHRADIYALGLTLYELLTMTPAFTADKRAKLLEQVLAANPARPRTVNPSVPRDLETIILKAIARDPASRYATAHELAEDLQRYLEGRTILARRASAAEQAWRWCKRNPAVASLLALTIAVLIIGSVVSTSFAMLAADRAREARGEAQRADDARAIADQRADKIAEQQAETRALLYGSRVSLAGVAARDFHNPRLIEFLKEAKPIGDEPDLRNWEWHYLHRLGHSANRSFALQIPRPRRSNDRDPEQDVFAGLMNARFSIDGNWLVAPAARMRFGMRSKSPLSSGAIFDASTGKKLRVLPPQETLQSHWLGDSKHSRHMARLEGIVDEKNDQMKVRLHVEHLATGEPMIPPIELPMPVRKSDDEELNGMNAPISQVEWTPDGQQLKAISRSGEVVYIWQRGQAKAEERRLRITPPKTRDFMRSGVRLATDTRTAYLIRTADTTNSGSRTPQRLVFELHDLIGPVADPTLFEWEEAPSLTSGDCSANGQMFATLEGKAGRIVRILDMHNKRWHGTWTIPANIPLAWDTQTNSHAHLHVSNDGQRVILCASTGIYILGERLGDGIPAKQNPSSRRETVEEWRTTVLLAPVGAGRGFEATWFSGDGQQFKMENTMYDGAPMIYEWNLGPPSEAGTTWPESLTIDGIDCQREPEQRRGTLDIYAGRGTSENPSTECVVAVRDYTTQQLVRQIRFHCDFAPNGLTSITPLKLNADGRRALVRVLESPDRMAKNDVFPPRPMNKQHLLLLALDRPDQAIVHRVSLSLNEDGPQTHVQLVNRWLIMNQRRELTTPFMPKKKPMPSPPIPIHSSTTGERVGTIPNDPNAWAKLQIMTRFITPDGESLIIVTQPLEPPADPKDTQHTFRCYSIATGQEQWQADFPVRGATVFDRPYSQPSPSSFTPDGRALVVASETPEGTIQAWMVDVGMGRIVREFVTESVQRETDVSPFIERETVWFPKIAVGPNNQLLLRSFSRILVWNGDDRKGQRLKGHELEIVGATFSADGSRLFTVDANDQGRRTVHVWDTRTWRELITFREPSSTAKVHCSCEDVPSNIRFVGGKLLLDSFRGALIFDGTPQRETP